MREPPVGIEPTTYALRGTGTTLNQDGPGSRSRSGRPFPSTAVGSLGCKVGCKSPRPRAGCQCRGAPPARARRGTGHDRRTHHDPTRRSTGSSTGRRGGGRRRAGHRGPVLHGPRVGPRRRHRRLRTAAVHGPAPLRQHHRRPHARALHPCHPAAQEVDRHRGPGPSRPRPTGCGPGRAPLGRRATAHQPLPDPYVSTQRPRSHPDSGFCSQPEGWPHGCGHPHRGGWRWPHGCGYPSRCGRGWPHRSGQGGRTDRA